MNFFGRQWYLFFAALLAIPLFILFETYFQNTQVHEDEANALAMTVCFMISIFTGRFVAQAIGYKGQEVPLFAVTILLVLFIALTGWIFFHADFPLSGRNAINLFLFWVPVILVGMIVGAATKLLRMVMENKLRLAQTEATHSRAELQQLQSQLSPHFLFNTLNNMYGLSISEHQKVPALLLKLSELLRYSVYEAGAPLVLLKEEWEYINNYIDFERLRLGERLQLSMNVNDDLDPGIRLVPMLLIVFVENAFKHTKQTTDDKVRVQLSLDTWGDKILFSVTNSCGRLADMPESVDKHSGFGLANVRKRLELQYPGEHELVITRSEQEYAVHLQLKIR